MYLLQWPTDYHFFLFLETAFLLVQFGTALVVFLYLQPPIISRFRTSVPGRAH